MPDTSKDFVADGCEALPAEVMGKQAEAAANLLKALSHEGRLMILCHLSSGEKSVTELEDLLRARQAAVSQLTGTHPRNSTSLGMTRP